MGYGEKLLEYKHAVLAARDVYILESVPSRGDMEWGRREAAAFRKCLRGIHAAMEQLRPGLGDEYWAPYMDEIFTSSNTGHTLSPS